MVTQLPSMGGYTSKGNVFLILWATNHNASSDIYSLSDMGHIPKQMFVWLIGFQICMCPGILLHKFMINYHSSAEFVVNQSLIT